jgi:hypothetical protein
MARSTKSYRSVTWVKLGIYCSVPGGMRVVGRPCTYYYYCKARTLLCSCVHVVVGTSYNWCYDYGVRYNKSPECLGQPHRENAGQHHTAEEARRRTDGRTAQEYCGGLPAVGYLSVRMSTLRTYVYRHPLYVGLPSSPLGAAAVTYIIKSSTYSRYGLVIYNLEAPARMPVLSFHRSS